MIRTPNISAARIALLAIFLYAGFVVPAFALSGNRPNIVLIVADDMNSYGFMGTHPDAQSPRLDADQTMIIVTSDNGYHVGEKDHFAKSTLWEVAARTPMAIRLPGNRPAGRSSQRVVGLIDWLPTFQHIGQLQPTRQTFDGRNG